MFSLISFFEYLDIWMKIHSRNQLNEILLYRSINEEDNGSSPVIVVYIKRGEWKSIVAVHGVTRISIVEILKTQTLTWYVDRKVGRNGYLVSMMFCQSLCWCGLLVQPFWFAMILKVVMTSVIELMVPLNLVVETEGISLAAKAEWAIPLGLTVFLWQEDLICNLAKRRFPDQSSMSTASSWCVELSWLKRLFKTSTH